MDIPRCDASLYELYHAFDGFRNGEDRRKKREWFRLVESEGDRNDGGDRLREEMRDGGAWSKK